MSETTETLPPTPRDADFDDLGLLLRDAIEGGASVGFMLPVREPEMTAYWQGVFADVHAGRRIVLATRSNGRIVGSVQLEFADRPNGRHLAELQKLLVLRP